MKEELLLLKKIRSHDKPIVDIATYEAAGGYQALKKTIKEYSPEQVRNIVKASKLRGRGGAGFSTGMKWSFVPMDADAARPKFLICNCDEMEPGTFKDRLLIEGDPHQVIEGMIIAAYAMDMDIGYIYCRWAYMLGVDRLKQAVKMAYDRGYLGKNILKSGLDFELHVKKSAGRYIIGEETALLNALEGKRGTPRSKPPFPPVKGLWGKPTIVNNVETFSNIPHIMQNGAHWFEGLGLREDAGTKIVGVSGRVKRPGCYELPMGVPLIDVIEDNAGGMQAGYEIQSIIPGGASTNFMTPDEFYAPLDFAGMESVDNRLGTAAIMVIDNKTCIVGFTAKLMHFFAQESCGWCTPCRDGLPWMRDIIQAFEDGDGTPEELEIVLEQAGPIEKTSFCALAPGAVGPLRSSINKFRTVYEEHIIAKRCTYEGGETHG